MGAGLNPRSQFDAIALRGCRVLLQKSLLHDKILVSNPEAMEFAITVC
jgi:hypothetical protein